MVVGYPGDDGLDGNEGWVTEERAEECFTAGLQAMREMIARFIEAGGHPDGKVLAESIRANWWPCWGSDPGRPDDVAQDCWSA